MEEGKSTESYEKYKDMLYRVAFSNMKNHADAQDAVQEAFVRYLRWDGEFAQAEHEKAWFIRTVINICRDMQKSAWNRRVTMVEELTDAEMAHFVLPYGVEDDMVWRIMELPDKYRNPMYLFYYEDYSIKEIAGSLEQREATVKTHLRRGREMLKQQMEQERNGKV